MVHKKSLYFSLQLVFLMYLWGTLLKFYGIEGINAKNKTFLKGLSILSFSSYF